MLDRVVAFHDGGNGRARLDLDIRRVSSCQEDLPIMHSGSGGDAGDIDGSHWYPRVGFWVVALNTIQEPVKTH